MSARNIVLLLIAVVVVVVGVIVIYDRGSVETLPPPGRSATADANRPSWYNPPTESGMTEFDYTEDNVVPAIDWESNIIRVCAWGAPDPDADISSQAEARIIAEQIARMRAYEMLAQTVLGLRLNSTNVLRNQLQYDGRLITVVEGFIQGARIADSRSGTRPDGSIGHLVCLEYRLKDVEENIQREFPEIRPVETYEEAEPEEIDVIAGIIIDARNVQVLPAMYPRILDEAGNVIYEASKVSQNILNNRRAVSYRNTLDRARALDFIGASALVVTAQDVSGPNRADIVISNDDVEQIQEWNERTDCFARGAVAFLLSPM